MDIKRILASVTVITAVALVGTACVPEESSGGKEGNAASSTSGSKKEKAVVFKVWGTAPSGVDINYGSDTDSRKGQFKNSMFEATLPHSDGALYYNVTGQLQGGGDIQCSVTVDGETKKGHASGGYNICTTQINAGLFGGLG